MTDLFDEEFVLLVEELFEEELVFSVLGFVLSKVGRTCAETDQVKNNSIEQKRNDFLNITLLFHRFEAYVQSDDRTMFPYREYFVEKYL